MVLNVCYSALQISKALSTMHKKLGRKISCWRLFSDWSIKSGEDEICQRISSNSRLPGLEIIMTDWITRRLTVLSWGGESKTFLISHADYNVWHRIFSFSMILRTLAEI